MFWALSWLGVYIGLSDCAMKLPSYITPSYPAVALLVASFISAWSAGTSRVASMWPRAAFACLGLVVVPWWSRFQWPPRGIFPANNGWPAWGLIPLLTAVVGMLLIRWLPHVRRLRSYLAAGAIALTTGMFAVGAVRVDSHQTFDSFVRILEQRSPAPQVGTLGVAEPSWVFYMGRPLDRLFVPEPPSPMPHDQTGSHDWQPKPSWNVWHYLAQSPDHYAITSEQYLQSIGGLRDDVEVVARTSYFLQDDTLLLIRLRGSRVQASGCRLQAPGCCRKAVGFRLQAEFWGHPLCTGNFARQLC